MAEGTKWFNFLPVPKINIYNALLSQFFSPWSLCLRKTIKNPRDEKLWIVLFSRLFDYFSKAERPRPEFRNMYVLFSELVENQNALFPQPFQALEKNNQKVQETKNFKTFRSLDSSASVVGHGHGQVTGRNPDSKAITYVQEFSWSKCLKSLDMFFCV